MTVLFHMSLAAITGIFRERFTCRLFPKKNQMPGIGVLGALARPLVAVDRKQELDNANWSLTVTQQIEHTAKNASVLLNGQNGQRGLLVRQFFATRKRKRR
jgi:hypothetical protein